MAKIPKFSDFVKDLYLRKIFAASRQNGYKTRGGFVAKVAKIPKFSDFVKDLYLRKCFAASRQNGDKTRGVVAKGGVCCEGLQ